MELPDPLEAFDGVGRMALVGDGAAAMEEGRVSHGGKAPSVDR